MQGPLRLELLVLIVDSHEPSSHAVGFLSGLFPTVFEGATNPYLPIALFQWTIYFLVVYLLIGPVRRTVRIRAVTRALPG
jgi:hypothetical protein